MAENNVAGNSVENSAGNSAKNSNSNNVAHNFFSTKYNDHRDDSLATIGKLIRPRQEKEQDKTIKVSVVGVGQVGMATVFALLTQGVSNNVVMVDTNVEKLKGEVLDMQHGTCFLVDSSIQASTDYALTKDSTVCIITAGVRQLEGESRRNLVQRNADLLKVIVPPLIKHSPDAVLIVACNPVDVMTYATWKISGLPKHRVIGAGTNLDTARFRYLLAQRLAIAPASCHGYIIGEHGDSSVPVWSGVNIAGVRLRDLNEDIGTDGDPENWKELHKMVVQSAYDIIKLKGYTSWAIGLSLAQITRAILNNASSVHAVTTCIKGEHGINEDIFLSLPCVLGHGGVRDIIRQRLTIRERELLLKSAATMSQMQADIKL